MNKIKTSADLKLANAISNHIYNKGKEKIRELIEENKRMASENPSR